jgi:hypothetical protein
VKRTLVLVPLTLVAALLVTSLADGQAVPVRVAPQQVTSSTTPKRDRTKPYVFTTRGRVVPPAACVPGGPTTNCVPLICPAGTSNPIYCAPPALALLCTGNVTVRFKKAGGIYTISARTVALKPDCTFSSLVSFSGNNPLRRGTLKVSTQFEGNGFLLPKAGPKRTVKAG